MVLSHLIWVRFLGSEHGVYSLMVRTLGCGLRDMSSILISHPIKIKYHAQFYKSMNKLFSNHPYYIFLRVIKKIYYFPLDIKRFFEKRMKGYNTRDLWNVGDYLSHHIIKALKDFKKVNTMSYPCSFKGIEEWHKEIDEMIEGFEMLLVEPTDLECWKQFNKKQISKKEWLKQQEDWDKEAEKKATKFIKNLNGLWD